MNSWLSALLGFILAALLTVSLFLFFEARETFLRMTIAEALNILALTGGVLAISLILEKRRAREEFHTKLLLDTLNEYSRCCIEAMDAFASARDRKLDLSDSADRAVLSLTKKGAQSWEDAKCILKKFRKNLSDCPEVKEVDAAFEEYRNFITGDTIGDVISARIITDADNNLRRLRKNILDLRLRVMEV